MSTGLKVSVGDEDHKIISLHSRRDARLQNDYLRNKSYLLIQREEEIFVERCYYNNKNDYYDCKNAKQHQKSCESQRGIFND